MSESNDPAATCLPTTTWFLYSEVEEQPLGRIFRKGVPEVGDKIEEGQGFQAAEVVSFIELQATCAVRRFKVVLRLLS